MPKLPLPLNLPLRVRGIKGVTSMGIMLLLACSALIAFLITPLTPLILRGGFWKTSLRGEFFGKIDEISVLRWAKT